MCVFLYFPIRSDMASQPVWVEQNVVGFVEVKDEG